MLQKHSEKEFKASLGERNLETKNLTESLRESNIGTPWAPVRARVCFYLTYLVWALEEHCQTRMRLTQWLSAVHQAHRSSHPSRGNTARTCGSCLSHRPAPSDSQRDHHYPLHPRAHHSHPHHTHREPYIQHYWWEFHCIFQTVKKS